MKKTYLILSVIILIGILTRFFLLGKAPLGINADEAGQGYSAYSILMTGKDEFGKSFPILFRSSEDFKTPVYTYMLVPIEKLFGMNPFSVRLPSAFFSVVTIPVVYFLVLELAKGKKNLALVTAILLAISPWAILFGRTAYECSVALFFLMSGCLFFYKGLKSPKLLILSAIFFAISIPAYHSERIVTPLLVFILFLKHWKTLLSKTHIKQCVIGAIIGFAVILPTLLVARTPGFFARVSDLNILSVGKPAGHLSDYNGFFSALINNKFILSFRELASLYISYFSPRFIFILGDSGPRSSFPELGTFFVWEMPFYLYGLYLVVNKKMGELNFFTLAFLLIAPIPAAFTRDPYSSTRALQMVIPLVIIVSLGVTEVLSLIKKINLKFLLIASLIGYSLLKLYSSGVILDNYYRGVAWEYGWEEASNVIKTLKPGEPVVVDSSRNVGYIQLAFFLKADPWQYQKDNFEVTADEYYTNLKANSTKKIGNITWRGINWEKDLLVKEYIVGDSLALSDQQIREHNLKLVKDIFYLDGSPDLRIVETNPKIISH